MTQHSVIAAFDFDGTLTYRDTLLPFLIYVVGPYQMCRALLLEIPGFIGYLFGRVSRQDIKEGILKNTIAGMPKEQLMQKGAEFALQVLPQKLRPEGIKKLHWHQSQGHRCILISANLNAYLEFWAKQMGFQDLLCSKLQYDAQNKATGLLEGKNCRGREKTVRLLDLLGKRKKFTLYAYGDSPGDKELLQLADYPFYRKF
jgi:HAD superfamily hydrolase (TIGR01490 family)